jgi:hypothetical protein
MKRYSDLLLFSRRLAAMNLPAFVLTITMIFWPAFDLNQTPTIFFIKYVSDPPLSPVGLKFFSGIAENTHQERCGP